MIGLTDNGYMYDINFKGGILSHQTAIQTTDEVIVGRKLKFMQSSCVQKILLSSLNINFDTSKLKIKMKH